MQDERDRRTAFEARLSELKGRMEEGLIVRAQTLRAAVARLLAGDESARKVIKQESHKLRGIAGSYGHHMLTELAAELEQRASLSPVPQLEELTVRLAQGAEQVGQHNTSAPINAAASPSSSQVLSVKPAPPRAASSARSVRGANARRPSVVGAHGGPLRVLAMDDDTTTLRLLHLTLKEVGGFDAVVVTAAHAALELLRLREFDIVISDAMMPDMNGQEFCRAARLLGGFAAHMPIVILSAATKDELEWHSGLPGPVVWLQKPFMPSTLVQDIAKIVKAHPLTTK
jgi:CheY-like chemotaxis protein/HPt (histidine-containing phosphotransfer) domain-containing protein